VVARRELSSGMPVRAMPEGVWLAPGFIDVQVNGGGDVLFNDQPDQAGITRIVAAHRRYGTTSLLPTLISDTPEQMRTAWKAVQNFPRHAGVAGIHFEGPFLSPSKPGVHPIGMLRKPLEGDIALLTSSAPKIKLITLAPNLSSFRLYFTSVERVIATCNTAACLALPGDYQAFLGGLGAKTRHNFRYYRRKFDAAGHTYVHELPLQDLRRAAADLRSKSRIPIQRRAIERGMNLLMAAERPWAAGLRHRDGRWLSVAAGWFSGGRAMLFLQLNDDRDHELTSLSVVLLEQELAIAEDRIHRCAQLVTDVADERFDRGHGLSRSATAKRRSWRAAWPDRPASCRSPGNPPRARGCDRFPSHAPSAR